MNSPDSTHPLYQLFTELRLAGLPLGIRDYEAVLTAVQGGLDESDRDRLCRLCQALWLKSADPTLYQLFAHHFERLIPLDYGRSAAPTPAEPIDLPTLEETAVSFPEETIELDDFPDDETWEQAADPVQQSFNQLQALSRLADEAQVAESSRRQLDLVSRFYYSFTGDYLPLTSRQMKQSWRYLRRAARFGPPVELDIDATVDKIARDGFLVDPVLRPRRTNRAQLILLLDRDGSMTPFHSLGRRLASSAHDGGRLGAANVFYFHDCPRDYLYLDPHYQLFVPLPDLLNHVHPLHTSVLIFSDAGAARGRIDEARVRQTAVFLQQLQTAVRHLAWLNPMPQTRWAASSAGLIARQVAMYETTRIGLQGAIKVLRGARPHAQERYQP
ncbi:MAG: CoxE [Ardenticatenaceae bacterium]|nr:CoxE [Ardenticatenaceae bacterium]MCB8986820.1 CoxE [Ardenticatenaceae bacterium]